MSACAWPWWDWGRSPSGSTSPRSPSLPDAEVVAVCDVRQDWAAEQARRFGIASVFTDFDAMLADAPFDALVNTASIPAHFPLNLTALRAGKHVYSQKPFASTVEEATILIDEAARRGLKMSCSRSTSCAPRFRRCAVWCRRACSGRSRSCAAARPTAAPSTSSTATPIPPGSSRRAVRPLLDMGVHGLHQVTGILGAARSVSCLSGVSEGCASSGRGPSTAERSGRRSTTTR